MRLLNQFKLALASAALMGGAAQAQNVQNFRPAVGTWNYFSVESARVAPHKRFVPSLTINYGNQPLTIRNADDEIVQKIVEHLITGDFQAAVGIGDRLEFGLTVPVNWIGAGDDAPFEGGVALGDIRITPKIRLFGFEDHDASGVGMAISIPVDLPTGDPDKFVGADQVEINPKLILEARVKGFSIAGNVGFKYRPDEKSFESLDLKNEITYGGAMGIDLGSPDALLFAEAFGVAPLQDINADSRSTPLEALLGFRFFTVPGAVITIGAGTGIIPDYGSPFWRGLMQFAYFERDRDTDGDGIMDSVDKCPTDPEDKDGFEDTDGCPDLDNDNDGILDVDDRCPLDPEDKDGFEDVDGCPDPDNDKDGILDIDDKCPNEPENVNGFEDTDGCPDVADTDGDGIRDDVDKCPKDPEDKDGFEDEDGCPDPDNDQDGILDVNDKCPMDPETMNGFEDEDGCPDKKLTLVKVTEKNIVILKKVFFETNKAVIKPVSFPVLNEVAEVMKTYTRIKLIEVQGHTDSRGKDAYNKQLSQERANSVRTYLMEKGVESERMTSVGYGEEEPIDTNKTGAGRANNRRVEFKILEQ